MSTQNSDSWKFNASSTRSKSRLQEIIKFRLSGRPHYRPRWRLPRSQNGQEKMAGHLYTPLWRSIEYSQKIADLPALRDCTLLTPKMRLTNNRWKDCNILTHYLVPLYLVDPKYYPNIQPTACLQALIQHYPYGTSPYIIYLHREFLLLQGIQEANSTEGFLRIVDEEYGARDFKWHVSVALEILSWLLIPNWCCICCDKNAEGIYRAAQRLNIKALVNLIEETPYGPILKSDDCDDQTRFQSPCTEDGTPLHSLVVPVQTKFYRPTCFFWSANLDFRDLKRLRRGMHLVDETFFALEVLKEWPFQTPLGCLLSSTGDLYDGEIDLSMKFLESRGEILRIYPSLDVRKLGITVWSFLNCITRITRNAYSLKQCENQINPDGSIGIESKDQFQRPGDASENERFLPFGTEKGFEPPCFSMQILDPEEKLVEEAARSVQIEEPVDDIFSLSFAGNSRPCYFFDRYEKRPHVLIKGNARTLELFLRNYSSLVKDVETVIVALRIRNPSPEIYHAVIKSVKAVGYDCLMQSMYIIEDRVLEMLNLLSIFQNLSQLLELHSILEIYDPLLSFCIYEITGNFSIGYQMDSRDLHEIYGNLSTGYQMDYLQETQGGLQSHEEHIRCNRASVPNLDAKKTEIDSQIIAQVAEIKESVLAVQQQLDEARAEWRQLWNSALNLCRGDQAMASDPRT